SAGGSPVSGKTITFTLNGSPVSPSATTDGNGTATLNSVSLSGLAAATYVGGVGASFAGDSDYVASNGSASLTVDKATPTVTWSNPADVTYGTALGGTQLNATFTAVVGGSPVPVAGTPTYTPLSGTVLGAGN